MAETALPSLFVSHGPPTMVLDDIPARRFLEDLGSELPRPRAILCVSAHWLAQRPTLSLSARPATIHDFFGFDPALYDLGYPAPGAPELARRAAALLEETGIEAELAADRGLDHGAWEPLLLMYPQADVPVLQLSLVEGAGAEGHLRVGRALAPLRAEGVLILCSGTAVHNLAQWRTDAAATPPWARAFEAWLCAAVERGDADAIADYRRGAPEAARAHPTEEHFLPLPVALGAAGEGAVGRILYRSFAYGSLSMAAFAFASDGELTLT